MESYTSYPSYFDTSKIIDRHNWGVTLIASAGSGLRTHHAQILVEIVKESGEYVKKVIDLVGGGSSNIETGNRIEGSWCSSYFGKIGVVKFTPEFSYEKIINHSGHSETWIRSADKVQAMLIHAQEEMDKPLANPRPFSIFGKKSKLAPEVKVYSIHNAQLETAYKKNPRLLIRAFQIASRYKERLETGTFSDFACTLHGGTLKSFTIRDHKSIAVLATLTAVLPSSTPRWLLSIPILITAEWTRRQVFGELGSYKEMLSIGCNALSNFSFLLEHTDCEEYRLDLAKLEENTSFLALEKVLSKLFLKILQGITEKTSVRDNCCTWALEKLAMLDIEMPDDTNGWFITDTRSYLQAKQTNAEKTDIIEKAI